ncbi:hypothetical protein VTN02DRAFT_5215 [Thermoascus thermophilus]
MASPVSEAYRPPISPPPPVYLRSSPPPHPASPDTPPAPAQRGGSSGSSSKQPVVHKVPRKPLWTGPSEVEQSRVIQQHSPVSPFRMDDASRLRLASSPIIDNSNDDYRSSVEGFSHLSLRDSVQSAQSSSDSGNFQATGIPPRKDSIPPMQLPQSLVHRQTPPSSSSWSLGDSHRKENSQSRERHSSTSEQGALNKGYNVWNNSSRGSVDSLAQPSEIYQPLQYHHQAFQDVTNRNGDRDSKTAIRSSSASSPMGESPAGSNSHLAPGKRPAGLATPQPNSAYSSVSDLASRGCNLSPQLSPHLRASSRNSTASPDPRPLSFIDLLNVPYPQPPPAPSNLSNAHLRMSVGNNASLLSHKQTFEMYLANVKKTNDPGVQYEFAVFMVNAVHEMPPDELEDGDSSTNTAKNPDITRAQLLRESRSILQRLADRSYPYAQYYLGDGYASGLFNKGKEDYDRAFPLFVAASKHGHAEAGYRAALCYEFGWGSRVDAAKAYQFYRQAASKNHPGAMLRLGRACLNGDMGLGKRHREGVKWLKRAAESADLQYNSAPYELGLLHETGFGDDVFPDPSYAAQLFTKSADLGHAEANYRLGDAYEHGKLNCPRDPALSVHFYTSAAQLGHPLAMMALCAWYLVGAAPVLEKDENEAYEWAKQAAAHGLPKAQYAVGYFTEMGIGCNRDPLEANVWYVKAADQGDERAKHRIAAIQAASEGANPNLAASGAVGSRGKKKPKRFGIF